MNRMIAVLAVAFVAAAFAGSVRGQVSNTGLRAPLAFDVVSVKPNTSGEVGGTSRAQPGRYQGINVTLKRVITLAYRPVQEFVGGPDWINTAHFDIEARSGTDPSPEQMLEMLRTLLRERFKLVVRHETRESPVYALTLARRDGRLGARLRQSDAECLPPGGTRSAPAPETEKRCGFRLGNGALSGQGATMGRPGGRTVIRGSAGDRSHRARRSV